MLEAPRSFVVATLTQKQTRPRSVHLPRARTSLVSPAKLRGFSDSLGRAQGQLWDRHACSAGCKAAMPWRSVAVRGAAPRCQNGYEPFAGPIALPLGGPFGLSPSGAGWIGESPAGPSSLDPLRGSQGAGRTAQVGQPVTKPSDGGRANSQGSNHTLARRSVKLERRARRRSRRSHRRTGCTR